MRHTLKEIEFYLDLVNELFNNFLEYIKRGDLK